ncbi:MULTISPECIES: fumarate/nitrate reduction transcriptional regulator Fnr [Vogesella]|uniref:Fumarate/nitrate reduction transcriptional regulator Fnr n=1 Tax=Vogesella aquatica TaxID=2984206 RepID=A0ABT5IYX9_9NEIS|nr:MULTISPECIES: fumarate/nitrate reduction transcriptional regulator Fnr [Vogesella]MDC7717411.1 fumarate/nitrate reduction transcriptional regulator Fnr [Vogesella aquatica]UDM16931.1 fumarate/nitrate reduction transcriptional regulator Fnr [Vogesella sp. XCS3]
MTDHTHSLHALKVSCSNCSLRELCLPLGLNRDEMAQLDAVIRQSRRLKRGEYLFRSGEGFRSLYAVRTGYFKTCVSSQDGREQVTGFHMSGELMGLDGISSNLHGCDAIALEDSEVCELPFNRMETLGRDIPSLQHHFFRLMSREIVRDQSVMLLLGNMKAEERLAAFLLNLSQRLSARGFAANDFILRMSREEIGSFLGLKLETVSRTLSKFQQQGWLVVDHKHIQLVKPEELKQLVAGCSQAQH